MVDFAKSFQVGLEQAKRAEVNRNEIDSVFDELNTQVGKATNDLIKIQREQFDEPRNALETIALLGTPTKKYWALTARHAVHEAAGTRELAKWQQGPGGYPCKISLRGEVAFCEDRAGLERELANLLADSQVGARLYGLLQYQPPAPES